MPCSFTKLAPILSLALLFFMACGLDGPTDKEVLINLVDGVIVPAYEAVSEDAARLEQDTQVLCDAPSSASLETAQESWRETRGSWVFSEAMWFGPVMDRRSLSIVDWSPTDTTAIDRLLTDGVSVSVEEARNVLASNQRGFGAIEYILFDNDALANLKSFPTHCGYLMALTRVVKEESATIFSEWVEGSDSPLTKTISPTAQTALSFRRLLLQRSCALRSS